MTVATRTSERVVQQLKEALGAEHVVTDRAGLGVYELDASDEAITGIHRPLAAVLPGSTEEVAEVARIAAEHDLPILARGSGTGLAGGAIATRGGIMVVLTRMNRIEEVSLVDRYAVVQPGVVNLDLSAYLAPHKFYYAPDPSSQRACSIGGNLGNNSGGPHCLKYGVTNNHVLGVEVVLPGGEVCWFGGPSAENPGHDLTGLVVGSECTLGIITKAMVRILPLPEEKGVLLATFDSIETASRAVSATIAEGILPSALEMMDKVTISAIEAGIGAGYPQDAAAVLLVELDGPSRNVADERERVAEILNEFGAITVSVARSDEEAERLWWGRKAAFGAMGRLAPNYHLTDTVVPRSKLPEAMRLVQEVARDYGLIIANVFHAGDGNLHPLILFDRREDGIMERVLEASNVLMQHCIDLGGAISGEHGIGIEKNDALALTFNDVDFEAMAKAKRAFDPNNLANPGKLFPSSFDPYGGARV
ncbi:MAG: FAD-linked oxidase C-terminal domain-containing protein [Thermomicrobiales bacterium]